MYRIRFHGRGGQGMKTASRMLGKALFLEGFEVQDAPRYGAERRGAPISAYVRSSRRPINERGIITNPDLIIVADDSLMAIPAAAVLSGCGPKTVLLIQSREEAGVWLERLNIKGPLFILPPLPEKEKRFLGAACAGGAARLLGKVGQTALSDAIEQEIGRLGKKIAAANRKAAKRAYDVLADQSGLVLEGKAITARDYTSPNWIEMPLEHAGLAAPAIRAAATSEAIKTGLWRTERPVIDEKRCNRCWWICSTFCPEGVIRIDKKRRPHIDYEHCKGCMVCLAQCPANAIEARPEEFNKPPGGNNR